MSELGKYYQDKKYVHERIKADALAKYPARMASPRFMVDVDMNKDRRLGYTAGATSEAAKTERLIEIMQEVIRISDRKHDAWDRAKEFIQQWKEGKEAEPVKEIEYMPVHPEDAKKPYCPRQFPMHLLDEQQAQRNHGQTLQRLKERGGLGVLEILSIVNKKPWTYYRDLKWDEALRMLNDLLTNPPK